MSEVKALALVFAATALLTCAACGVLISMNVNGSLIAVAFVAIAGTGSHLLSRVVMHYD
jgi:hypothetical protein